MPRQRRELGARRSPAFTRAYESWPVIARRKIENSLRASSSALGETSDIVQAPPGARLAFSVRSAVAADAPALAFRSSSAAPTMLPEPRGPPGGWLSRRLLPRPADPGG